MYILFLVRRKREEKSINYGRNQTFKREMSIINLLEERSIIKIYLLLIDIFKTYVSVSIVLI